MNGCFVSQYNYPICWAASLATVVRNQNNIYFNSHLNAFDVVENFADQYDYSLDVNDDNSAYNRGATIQQTHYMLAMYNVYYGLYRRALNYNELKEEINHGKPICMRSVPSSGSGHMTVGYGYATLAGVRYCKMWNPATSSTEMAVYTNKGVKYTFNDKEFTWVNTLAKATYVTK